MPVRDNMITPSLESTSCLNAGIFEPVPPSVLNRGNAPLLPFVSAFSGKQPRGSNFDRLVPDLPPVDFIKHALSVTVQEFAPGMAILFLGLATGLQALHKNTSMIYLPKNCSVKRVRRRQLRSEWKRAVFFHITSVTSCRLQLSSMQPLLYL